MSLTPFYFNIIAILMYVISIASFAKDTNLLIT